MKDILNSKPVTYSVTEETELNTAIPVTKPKYAIIYNVNIKN